MFRNLTASEQRSLVTRLLMSIFALVTALAITDRSSFAQSAYSYPWCLERGIGGPRSCYYSSYEQCRMRLSPEEASARRARTIEETKIGLWVPKRHAIDATARILKSRRRIREEASADAVIRMHKFRAGQLVQFNPDRGERMTAPSGPYDDPDRFFRACPTVGVRSPNSLRAY
jgi:hypothetical protein